MTIPSPSPQRDGSRTALIAGIVVTALLLVGVGVTALVLALSGSSSTSDDDDKDDRTAESSPEEAFEAFVKATNDGDCAVLVLHPITDLDSVEDCEDTLEQTREDAEDAGYDYDSFSFVIDEVEVVEQDETTATIAAEATQSYELDGSSEEYNSTLEYELEKDGDRWIVVELVTEDVDDVPGPSAGD